MYSHVPGTAKEIIDSLILDFDYSVKQIGEILGISKKTIYRIKKGLCPKPITHLNLIQLYLSLYNEKFKQESSCTN